LVDSFGLFSDASLSFFPIYLPHYSLYWVRVSAICYPKTGLAIEKEGHSEIAYKAAVQRKDPRDFDGLRILPQDGG
jgi:hypothetical protein